MIWTLWKSDGTTKLYTDHKFLWEEIKGTNKTSLTEPWGKTSKALKQPENQTAKAVIDLFCHSQEVWGDMGGPGLLQPWGDGRL